MATMMAIIDPGDEVVIFEPFYENYGPDAILSGATPRYVTLHEPDWHFDRDELATRSTTRRRRSSSTRRTIRPGSVHAREARDDCRALRKWDAIAISGRDLRAHHLRRHAPHPDRDARRHGRTP